MLTRSILGIGSRRSRCSAAGGLRAVHRLLGGSDGDGTTLEVWSWRTEDVDEYEKIFDAYEAEHEGVTVEFKPYVATEYDTILSTGLSAEGGPDVAQLRAYGGLQPLCEAGRLVELEAEDVDTSAHLRRRARGRAVRERRRPLRRSVRQPGAGRLLQQGDLRGARARGAEDLGRADGDQLDAAGRRRHAVRRHRQGQLGAADAPRPVRRAALRRARVRAGGAGRREGLHRPRLRRLDRDPRRDHAVLPGGRGRRRLRDRADAVHQREGRDVPGRLVRAGVLPGAEPRPRHGCVRGAAAARRASSTSRSRPAGSTRRSASTASRPTRRRRWSW